MRRMGCWPSLAQPIQHMVVALEILKMVLAPRQLMSLWKLLVAAALRHLPEWR